MELVADLWTLAHIGVAMAMIGGLVGSRMLNRSYWYGDLASPAIVALMVLKPGGS